MELTLLFILLPVAAASGWWLAKRHYRTGLPAGTSRPAEFSADYFRGLNLLLNEQPDKAIDVFVKMLQVDNDTVETHLALGNLFRSRGEGDRAIRIHQNLIARPTLSKAQRALALFELAQDYLRAGLLGRAESLFEELLAQNEYRAEALAKLLDIYQQEKEWQKAIDTAQRYEHLTGQRMNLQIAHFYCELGEQAFDRGDYKTAMRLARRALNADRQCVRASLLQARAEQANGDYRAAIKSLKQVEKQDTGFLPEIVAPLLACYQSLEKTGEAERYLEHLSTRYGGITPLLGLADLLCQRGKTREASERIVKSLSEKPSVRGLNHLIELHLLNSEGAARENLLILKELTHRLLEEKLPYRCTHCGFKVKTLQWRCPTCKEWASIRPIQGVVGE
ncbi:MAG TPA: lipopolysaccharide assembly protein LapB [Gammaproteobacteria bacterium]|nr:lipopolysaccharide assembly protein LapB [Gammaproteobacteria bacterium]